MKRTLSNQGSPPPTNSKTKKKSRLSTSVVANQNAMSSPPPPPLSSNTLQWPTGSRSRSRSASIEPESRQYGHAGPGRGVRDGSVAGNDGAGGATGEQDGVEQQEAQDGDNEDDDDNDDLFSDDEFGLNQKQMAREKEDLRVLLEHFDAEQMDRYEAFRRSGLTKGAVRKLVNNLAGQNVPPSVLTVVRGFAKVFVGEIVEKGECAWTAISRCH
ncbi:transcription initiation factor TFIID subunit 11 [Microbotryomycetes sp. JL201]|nr:transcription initiation factor TFIID subunit 11 [Microbotryomycetes sp. JL201]